jgi:hypothetical protein
MAYDAGWLADYITEEGLTQCGIEGAVRLLQSRHWEAY